MYTELPTPDPSLPPAQPNHNAAQVPDTSLENKQLPAAAAELKEGHTRVLFRGSFNPFHEGHLNVVQQLLARGYTTVVITPVGTSPGKGEIDTPMELRAEMIIRILQAEGIKIAATPDEPGVYVARTAKERRTELVRAVSSLKTDFAMGADNDATYSEHRRWRLFKKFGEDRLAIVHGESNTHASDIRAGRIKPHPAITGLIIEHRVYPDAIVDRPGLSRFKEVMLLYNPNSGSGKGKQTAEALAAKIVESGIKAVLQESKKDYAPGELAASFKGKDLIIVSGGDGTLMGSLAGLAESKVPVYMMPQGNESLFSKLFGMTREAQDVMAHLGDRQIRDHYYGLVNGRPFFLMVTVGFDAMVVEEVAKLRKTTSSDKLYKKALLNALPHYHSPRISLKVDGETVINNEKGYINFANAPIYARGLNPVPDATSLEQGLHVRFYPQSGLRGLLSEVARGISLGRSKPADIEGSRLYFGKRFELVVHNGPYAAQADGDYFGQFGKELTIIEAAPSPIRVLDKP